MTSPLDDIVEAALRTFFDDIRTSRWQGHEHEAISLFVFAHLLPFCQPGSVLHDPAQICIECAVPQLTLLGTRQKPQVGKDLVIWPKAKMTCWDSDYRPVRYPAAILEWKVTGLGNRFRKGFLHEASADRDWLTRFSAAAPSSVGYSVSLENKPGAARLQCSRAYGGELAEEWLVL